MSGVETAAGEHQDLRLLAGPVRQHHGATDHLVGVLRIDAETNGDVHPLVELGKRIRLRQLDRLVGGIPLRLDGLGRLAIVLSMLRHDVSSLLFL
jgi:hypothetical protein